MLKMNRSKFLLLVFMILLLLPACGAWAAMDTHLHTSSINIAAQARLSTGVHWNASANDRVTEYYIEYTPNDIVKPIVTYGNYIYGGNKIPDINTLMQQRGYTVVAGINADYFNMGTVVSISTLIEDYVLKGNEGSAWASVGFYDDGRAIIDRLNITMQVEINGVDYTLYKLNKELQNNNGLQLYSRDYADTTRSTMASYAAILQPQDLLRVNSNVYATVSSVAEYDRAVDIPDGSLVLIIAQSCENEAAKNALNSLNPGDGVQIKITAGQIWNNVRYAVGGGEKLLTNGQVVATATANSARSALGVRADGSFVMYAAEGRRAGLSTGASLVDVARRLQALGCIEAVNLDGGGSTTFQAILPGDTTTTTLNRPTDGNFRTCANYILLVHQQRATGYAANLHLYPYDVRILAGSSVEFSAVATDQYYLSAPLPGGGIEYSVAFDGLGSVSGNRFTAGSMATSGYVQASSGGISGSAYVTVVTQPDSARLVYADTGDEVASEIRLYAGNTVQLSVEGTHDHLPVIADAGAATWSLTGEIGTIDSNGLLTIYPHVETGAGILSATIGNRTVTVTINIGTDGDVLEDFEQFSPQVGTGWTLSDNSDKAYVRYGHLSGRLDYDFLQAADPEAGRLSIPLNQTFTSSPSSIDFWVYGDGSSNRLMLRVLAAGESVELQAATLGNRGWQRVSVTLPEGVTALSSLELLYSDGASSGTIYLDQLMACYGVYIDTTPPQINLTLTEGNSIQATITDTQDAALQANNIRLRYDGQALSFNYDSTSKVLTASLPEQDGLAHRISLTARDKSGNIGRAALDIAATVQTAQPFADMSGHWAEEFTTYLYQRGIVNGMESNGSFIYAPNTNMNRAQFAVIMANWLDLDLEQYAGVVLPFADLNSIGEWALPAVRAMYSLGITQGSALDGRLYFNPTSAISRAEAMTMIGRTQERGYAESELNFADNASIPSWAAPYIRPLVAQGVISGVGENRLASGDSVTRGQVAKMLYSLM